MGPVENGGTSDEDTGPVVPSRNRPSSILHTRRRRDRILRPLTSPESVPGRWTDGCRRLLTSRDTGAGPRGRETVDKLLLNRFSYTTSGDRGRDPRPPIPPVRPRAGPETPDSSCTTSGGTRDPGFLLHDLGRDPRLPIPPVRPRTASGGPTPASGTPTVSSRLT